MSDGVAGVHDAITNWRVVTPFTTALISEVTARLCRNPMTYRWPNAWTLRLVNIECQSEQGPGDWALSVSIRVVPTYGKDLTRMNHDQRR